MYASTFSWVYPDYGPDIHILGKTQLGLRQVFYNLDMRLVPCSPPCDFFVKINNTDALLYNSRINRMICQQLLQSFPALGPIEMFGLAVTRLDSSFA